MSDRPISRPRWWGGGRLGGRRIPVLRPRRHVFARVVFVDRRRLYWSTHGLRRRRRRLPPPPPPSPLHFVSFLFVPIFPVFLLCFADIFWGGLWSRSPDLESSLVRFRRFWSNSPRNTRLWQYFCFLNIYGITWFWESRINQVAPNWMQQLAFPCDGFPRFHIFLIRSCMIGYSWALLRWTFKSELPWIDCHRIGQGVAEIRGRALWAFLADFHRVAELAFEILWIEGCEGFRRRRAWLNIRTRFCIRHRWLHPILPGCHVGLRGIFFFVPYSFESSKVALTIRISLVNIYGREESIFLCNTFYVLM